MHSWIVLALCATAVVAERISQNPDVSWNRRDSVSSRDSDRSGSNNNDDSRFPITGSRFSGSGTGSGSRASGSDSRLSGSDSRFTGSDSRLSGSDSRLSGSGSRFSGSDSSLSGSRSSGDPNYVQIIASIVRLNNKDGKVNTGSTCASFGGKCDPLIYANLDTERPNANWPGAQDVKFWPLLLTAKKANDLDINISNITKQYCGQKYTEANLRVHIEDKKSLSSNAIINDFECPINRDPARDQFAATWSPEAKCVPKFPKGGQELVYKYKVFYVDRLDCGVTPRPTTTTKGSWFGK